MIKKIVTTVVLTSMAIFAEPTIKLPNNELQLALLSKAAQKKAIVLMNMHLKGKQKEEFGNLYDEYQLALMKSRIDRLKLIEEYAKNYLKMTNETADRLLADWVRLKKEEAKIQEEFIPKFKKIIPSAMVIRFYQIENRLDLSKEIKRARMIPLAIPNMAKSEKLKPQSPVAPKK